MIENNGKDRNGSEAVNFWSVFYLNLLNLTKYYKVNCTGNATSRLQIGLVLHISEALLKVRLRLIIGRQALDASNLVEPRDSRRNLLQYGVGFSYTYPCSAVTEPNNTCLPRFVARAYMNIFVFLLYTAFVTYASVRPMDGLSIAQWDKAGHFVLYSVFALLGSRIVSNQMQFRFLCTGIVIYSGLMEIVQSFIPKREMSAYDLLANAIGVLAGAAMAKWVLRAENI